MFHHNLLLPNGDFNFAELNNEYNAKGEVIIIQEQAEKSGIPPWGNL